MAEASCGESGMSTMSAASHARYARSSKRGCGAEFGDLAEELATFPERLP